MGHMNNAAYLEYVDDCGHQALSAHGWPPGRMRECGFDICVQRHQIEYRQPALPDDVLEVDHIIPRAVGGRDAYTNWQLLHRYCHVVKTARERQRFA